MSNSDLEEEVLRLRNAERIGQTNVQEARPALALIRQAVEEVTPVGTVPNSEYLDPSFDTEARAIIAGIEAMADSPARLPWRVIKRHGDPRGRYVSILQKPDGTPEEWRVEEIDGDGDGSCFVAEFSGHHAEDRARRFAERLNTHTE